MPLERTFTWAIVDVNVYDNEVFGTGEPGCAVSAYDSDYADTHADPVIQLLIPGWYPPTLDDDHWLDPIELPRRIRRALINKGAQL